ncbi:MAG: hypothetical protein LUQ65_12515, partial [Candidatus Helarchaeota archaeon]|nr:hypothetical protein [Candidatus Helarchaeota archaeon]
MSRPILNRKNNALKKDLYKRFKEADLSNFPDFDSYRTPLDKALWILWVAKDEFGVKHLTAEEIATIIKEAKETIVEAKSIVQAFHRAGDKIYIYSKNNKIFYEIMKQGKDYLSSQIKGSVEIFYFEPGKR